MAPTTATCTYCSDALFLYLGQWYSDAESTPECYAQEPTRCPQWLDGAPDHACPRCTEYGTIPARHRPA